ncbi:hypothetical protein CDAR_483991 [Caerostris darwini]|uniref:Uncharacterized protein n=1 Tax=Caerostris darwini TaxID=1538125 RepID=A0AAV4TA80_9ARAC|nr:hypothetical protein CDAR_483991 [Caerostris darwini]
MSLLSCVPKRNKDVILFSRLYDDAVIDEDTGDLNPLPLLRLLHSTTLLREWSCHSLALFERALVKAGRSVNALFQFRQMEPHTLYPLPNFLRQTVSKEAL